MHLTVIKTSEKHTECVYNLKCKLIKMIFTQLTFKLLHVHAYMYICIIMDGVVLYECHLLPN